MFCLNFINTSRPSVFPSHFSLICRLKKNEWNPQNPPILCNMECSIQKLSACGGGKTSSSFYKIYAHDRFPFLSHQKIHMTPQNRQNPWNSDIGDRLPQGFCAQYVSSFPLWGSRPEMRIFSLWRGSGPFGLPFLLRASIPQKNRSLSHPPRCESIKVGESANSARQLCSFQKPDIVVQVGGLGIPVSGSRVRKRMGTITKN